MIATLKAYLDITRLTQRQIMMLASLAMLGGALNVCLIALITAALKIDTAAELPALAISFAFVGGVLLLCQDYTQGRVARLAEASAAAVREQLIHALDGARLLDLERLPHTVKQAAVGRDVDILATALAGLIGFVASSTTVVCALLYMAFLFPLGALGVIAVIVLAIALYRRKLTVLMVELSDAQVEYDRFFRLSEDLLLGQKELKMDRSWASYFLQQDVLSSLRQAEQALGRVKQRQQRASLLGTASFLMLLGGATFLLILNGQVEHGVSTGFVLALILLNSPIQTAVSQLPALGATMVSMRRIAATLTQLRRQPEVFEIGRVLPKDWQQLRLRHLTFTYEYHEDQGTDAATPKPALRNFSLDIRRGDLVFLVGGNGSGKTTLAKLILGLYEPSQGGIWLDDHQVGPMSLTAYRGQFSTVFSDAHLFSRGFDDLPDDTLAEHRSLLRQLRLSPKLDAKGCFDTKALSQGQKKRLALACAMVDDKPILLLDEWTADQDPEFRAMFYESFLVRWRQSDKTVIVITHDDRYFHHADLLVTLEDGCLRSVVRQPRTTAGTSSVPGGICSAV